MKIFKIAYLTTATILGLALVSCTSTRKNQAEENSGDRSSEVASEGDVKLHSIYFDFDKSNIRSDQQKKAEEMANSLKDRPKAKVQIQGNTDDRGSVEYNLALGSRRAESLRKYLSGQGVDTQNMEIVSYGKERPTAQGNDESAWEKNRRDDVVIVGE